MITRTAMIVAILAIVSSLLYPLQFMRKRKLRSEEMKNAYARILRRTISYIKGEIFLLALLTVSFFIALLVLFGKNTALYFLFGSVSALGLLLYSTFIIPFSGMMVAEAEDISEQSAFGRARGGALSIAMMACGLPLLLSIVLYKIYSFASVMESMAAFAFGACLIGLFIRAKSGVYTKILDILGSCICAVSAVILLAECSILEAGVGVGFSRGMAAVFAFALTAAGIGVSFVLSMTLRGKTPEEVSKSLSRIVYLTSAIIAVVSVYFAYRFLGHYEYCIPGVAGSIASVVCGKNSQIRKASEIGYERMTARGSDGPNGPDRDPMVRNLRFGLLSAMVPVFALSAAVYASYYFAGFYGIALAALTASSTSGIQMVATTIPQVYRNAHILRSFQRKHTEHQYLQFEVFSGDLLGTGDGLAIAEATLATAALYGVYTRSPLFLSIDLANPFVMLALLIGVMVPFCFIAGSLGNPMKAEAHVKRRMLMGFLVILLILLTAFLFGAEVLGGEIVGIFCAGILISLVAANSGASVRVKSESVSNTLIKLAVSMSLTFLPILTYSIFL